jgi:hypothetical protein
VLFHEESPWARVGPLRYSTPETQGSSSRAATVLAEKKSVYLKRQSGEGVSAIEDAAKLESAVVPWLQSHGAASSSSRRAAAG